MGTASIAIIGDVGFDMGSFAAQAKAYKSADRGTWSTTVISLRTGPRNQVKFIKLKNKRHRRLVSLDIGRGGTETTIYNVWLRLPLYAISGLFAVYPSITIIRGPLRRWRRRKRGLCVNCGYNLTGNVSGVCSECGTPFDLDSVRPPAPISLRRPGKMNKRKVICVLFGCGATLGVLPMLLWLFAGPGPYTLLLFPGITLTFLITGDTHSEAGLFWITVFNVVVYGLVSAGVGWVVTKRHVPIGRRCVRCSHDLTGNVSGVCPECGTRIEEA